MKTFVQYHKVEQYGIPGLPTKGEAKLGIQTKKPRAGGVAKGDFVLLIAGFPNEFKRCEYRLWSRFSVDEISEADDGFVVRGSGRYLLLPPALDEINMPGWTTFLKYMQNFRRGFSSIDDHPYTKRLSALCNVRPRKVGDAQMQDFCDHWLSYNEHVCELPAEDLARLYESRGLIRLCNAGRDAILRSMAKKDCMKASDYYEAIGQDVRAQLSSANRRLQRALS